MSTVQKRLAHLERRALPQQQVPQPDPWTLAAEAIWAELPDHVARQTFLGLVRAAVDATEHVLEVLDGGRPAPELDAGMAARTEDLDQRIRAKLEEMTGGDPATLARLCHCVVADLARDGYLHA